MLGVAGGFVDFDSILMYGNESLRFSFYVTQFCRFLYNGFQRCS